LGIDWQEQESTNFRIVYHESHAYLVPHILSSAESALARLCSLFNYVPIEKIVINTYDVNDYGSAFTTTVPHNYIWLDVAPMEPGYENIPYNERIRWLISHELVHVVVNDVAPKGEALSRSLFSKVQPEQTHPLSVVYSLLTNYSRYTPRWHQEGIAVFLETWLSGGYGRAMGSFDEMFFRSMVVEGRTFPSDIALETDVAPTSHLIETTFYLYGGRFVTFLAKRFGIEKLIRWYRSAASYTNFKTAFRAAYGISFDVGWQSFIEAERAFQETTLAKLRSAPRTFARRLSNEPLGAVTSPHRSADGGAVVFGRHKPSELAEIVRLELKEQRAPGSRFSLLPRGKGELATNEPQGSIRVITSLSAPSVFHVASTAFDARRNRFFFTTNNNQLYRDVRMVDLSTGERHLLFEDARVGHLTVSPTTHDLWGVRHAAGVAHLVLSVEPYDSVRELLSFDFGDELQGLSVNPSGDVLVAVLHRASGEQSIVVVDAAKLKAGSEVSYTPITNEGSPEFPSWSTDGTTLYWNAYTNGISNIYRKRFPNGDIEAVTHTLRGFFKPIELSRDSLFAFEFSSEGFFPVILPNGNAERLPAISYLGQEVLDKFPVLNTLSISTQRNEGIVTESLPDGTIDGKSQSVSTNSSRTTYDDSSRFVGRNPGAPYQSLRRIELASLFPVISGFQKQKVLGLFAHFSDPILDHDFTIEAGVSPFGENVQPMRFHLKLKYEYQKEYEVNWEHNGPDFFDLFNARKRGMLGDKIRLANTHYWIFDNPLKTKQLSEIVLYTNVSSINDNIVRVSQPDFVIAQTAFNSQNLRRSIGSVDFENGNEFNCALMFFGSNLTSPQTSFNLYGEWDSYSIALAPHNVFHFKFAAGVHQVNDKLLQSRFYFGGFGNRALENANVKQYRKVFSFPGIPVFSLGSDRFAKLMFENNFPPVRFGNLSLGEHYVSHLDASIFSQALLTKSAQSWWGADLGMQISFVLKHWFNLESTLSAGVARAWMQRRVSDEWFVSWKLLKN
jgi:hypothetical protein